MENIATMRYLRVTYAHSTNPETDGELTKKEAYTLAKQAATATRLVNDREYLIETHNGETWAEFYFKTTTYYNIPDLEELKECCEGMFINNCDFSADHALGERFDSGLLEDSLKIIAKLPANVQALALPAINFDNVVEFWV